MAGTTPYTAAMWKKHRIWYAKATIKDVKCEFSENGPKLSGHDFKLYINSGPPPKNRKQAMEWTKNAKKKCKEDVKRVSKEANSRFLGFKKVVSSMKFSADIKKILDKKGLEDVLDKKTIGVVWSYGKSESFGKTFKLEAWLDDNYEWCALGFGSEIRSEELLDVVLMATANMVDELY